MNFVKRTVLYLLPALILFSLIFRPVFAEESSSSKVDTAAHAMVVTAHSHASQVGINILQQGGNAVDAAVAAAFVIGVTEPYASGLGGGGGMIIYQKRGHNFRYLDYYMQSPQQVDTAFSDDKDTRTPRSICIPGTPSGLITAVRKYGKLPLMTVMAPAIDIARQGIIVNQHFYEAVLDVYEVIMQNPATAAVFCAEGLPYAVGDTIPMPGLLKVLENLAEFGEDYFYRGEFARSATEAIRKAGGLVTFEDFSAYRTIERTPLNSNYRNVTIFTAPPPQSGITLLEILNIVENAPAQRWNNFNESAFSIHLMLEAIKRADADRYHYLGDPRFFEVPAAALSDKRYAVQRYLDIDTARVKYANNRDIPAGDPQAISTEESPSPETPMPQDGPHTTHISVVDTEGNAVSLTQTIGLFFGSGFSVDGVIFNSSMSVFYRKPSPNHIQPFKRPASTICPTIIMKDARIFSVLGTPGGGRIFNTMAEVIMRLVDFKQPPFEAVDAPRFNTRISMKEIALEKRFPAGIVDELRQRGHQVRLSEDYELYYGGMELIYFDPTLLQYIGVSDPRRSGAAIGY
jgi:gamma-glutamyltranspeptidase/glutathione hydrolase